MSEAVKKAKKRADPIGREPVRQKLGDLQQQGSNGMHSSPDNLKALQMQGSNSPTHKDSLLKLGQLQRQK